MQPIGVLGGMSSVASSEYYRLLNEGVNARLGGHAAAEVVLYSVDFAVIEACIRTGRWEDAAAYLAERARRLERAGAEFLLLATNTLHRVAQQIQAAVSIPLVHIVDVAADAAIAAGVSTLGLLGTAPVMEAGFYRDRFAERGLTVVVPGEQDRALVHRVIFDELTHGLLLEESRRQYLRVIGELADQGAQAVVLGCTEVSLLVAPQDLPAVLLFDTTELHIQRAVEIALDICPLPGLAFPAAAVTN